MAGHLQLNQKMSGRKFQPRMSTRKKILNQSHKKFGLIKAYCLLKLKSNCLIFFVQNVHLLTKYLLREKLAFSLHYKLIYKGGGGQEPPPPALSFGQMPSLSRINGPTIKNNFFCGFAIGKTHKKSVFLVVKPLRFYPPYTNGLVVHATF